MIDSFDRQRWRTSPVDAVTTADTDISFDTDNNEWCEMSVLVRA